ncbi:MAG: hypothetical protein LAT55_08930 [Opitutales bacterium]|nr:hypothetical protein [Opitutales bacterium]
MRYFLSLFIALFGMTQFLGAQNIRPRMPVALNEGTPIFQEDRSTQSRTALEGEVMMVRRVDGDWFEGASPISELGSGWVRVADAEPTDSRSLNAFRQRRREVLEVFAEQEQAETAAAFSQKQEQWTQEDAANSGMASSHGPTQARTSTFVPQNAAVAGYFSLGGSRISISDIAVSPFGDTYIAGDTVGIDVDLWGERIRPWLDNEVPEDLFERPVPMTFILRLNRDLQNGAELFLASPRQLGAITTMRVNQQGKVYLLVSGHDQDEIANAIVRTPDLRRAGNTNHDLLILSPDLKTLEGGGGIRQIRSHLAGFEIDDHGRPTFFADDDNRSPQNVPALTRLHSNARAEAPFAAQDNGYRIFFNLHNPPFTDYDNPFSIWGTSRTTYPPTATPIAKFGSRHNAGQEIKWGGSEGQRATGNPYGLQNLMAENMIIDLQGNIILGGTVPHNMPMPGFDPFLASYSPDGELRWGNILLDGFLSEPDQKNQAIAIDPRNGDILVSFRQHGNNVHSMILHPDGFLNRYTGTEGDIMITWIGRIDADSGELRNSTYLYSRMPRNYDSGWPDLSNYFMYGNGNLAVDNDGFVYVSGMSRNVSPTTRNGFIPHSRRDGFMPVLHVLTPDLSQLSYGTYLSETDGRTLHTIPFPDGTIFNYGTIGDSGPFHTAHTDRVDYLTDQRPDKRGSAPFIVLLNPEKGGQRHQWRFAPSPQSQD